MPRELQEITFKSQLGAMYRRGEVVYLSEARRAINLLRSAEGDRVDYFDCALTLGQSVYDFELGSKHIVLACDHEGVGLIDMQGDQPSDTLRRFKLGGSFVESVRVCGDWIIAAGFADGLCSLRIEAGKLQVVHRYRENDFRARRLHRVAGEIWACGVDGDDRDGILVFDPANFAEPRLKWFFDERSVGEQLLTMGRGQAISFRDETCVLFDAENQVRTVLFEMYASDADGRYLELPPVEPGARLPEALDQPRTSLDEVQWVQPISDDYWAISHSDELAIYRLNPGVSLRNVQF